jgi:hypothetical protein
VFCVVEDRLVLHSGRLETLKQTLDVRRKPALLPEMQAGLKQAGLTRVMTGVITPPVIPKKDQESIVRELASVFPGVESVFAGLQTLTLQMSATDKQTLDVRRKPALLPRCPWLLHDALPSWNDKVMVGRYVSQTYPAPSARTRENRQRKKEQKTPPLKDPDFHPLRGRDDFKKLLAELETRNKAKAAESAPPKGAGLQAVSAVGPAAPIDRNLFGRTIPA